VSGNCGGRHIDASLTAFWFNNIAAVFLGSNVPKNVVFTANVNDNDVELIYRNPLWRSLSLPLLFPHDEPGLRIGVPHDGVRVTAKYNKLTCRQVASESARPPSLCTADNLARSLPLRP
jgi:hypothetical protein